MPVILPLEYLIVHEPIKPQDKVVTRGAHIVSSVTPTKGIISVRGRLCECVGALICVIRCMSTRACVCGCL